MSQTSTPASRWAVSTRTNGEVLTAGISRAELDLVVLGVPSGFSQPELEGWLHDLAGVAVETSRVDSRSRAIPALMHHALTGLLFSHAELWDRIEAPRPCSSAFVDLPEGAAFGWVGDARVHVLVDGDPVEPNWVRVRDEAGREARAAVFAPGADVVVTLEYWPQGDDGGIAPASLEAEWIGAIGGPVAVAGSPSATLAAFATAPTAAAETPDGFEVVVSENVLAQPHLPWRAAESQPAPELASAIPEPHALYPELPETLPVQQPGLAGSAMGTLGEAANESRTAQPAASEWHAAEHGVIEMPAAGPKAIEPWPAEPAGAEGPAAGAADSRAPFAAPEASGLRTAATATARSRPAKPASAEPEPQAAVRAPLEGARPRPAHPVARWLSRVMNWGRRDAREPAPAATEPETTSVSAYDSLLSESVPPTPLEQTALDLAASAPASAAPHDAAPIASPVSAPPGTLRPAGSAEILGTSRPVVLSTPAVPADSPSGSIAINDRLQALLREIEAAEAGHMPAISPAVPEGAGERPLGIDHEPVGADESFGIPPLPAPLGAVRPDDAHVMAIPSLPLSRVVVANAPPAAAPVAPSPPPAAAPVAPSPPPATAPPAAALPAPIAAAEPRPLELAPAAPPMLRVPLPVRASAPLDLAPSPPETAGITPALEGAPVETLEGMPAPTPRRARSLGGPETAARPKPPLIRRPGVWAAGVVAVFVVGWLVGGFSAPGADRGGPVMAALRALGIGGAHFTASINSSPGGAHIEIDGQPQATRTPATLELSPGAHVVKLLLPGLGSVEVPLQGRNGEKLTIDEPLDGSLEILDTDSSVPIAVSIDGRPAGYAPLKVERIAPGLHEVGFSGPGMPSWAQSVQVDVRGSAQLIARPMTAPANGVIQVQATLNDERGTSPLPGAQVVVDGEPRGVTPLSIELPRGPHSLRVTWRGETAPIQVIDLPGGNQRFATFNFGLDLAGSSITLLGATRTFASGETKVVSASVAGLSANDVHEAWLHVRGADGPWRRYAMTVLRGSGNPVVTSIFPDNVFDRQGNTRWYVSVTTSQGDETYSEIQQSSLATPAGKPGAGRQQP